LLGKHSNLRLFKKGVQQKVSDEYNLKTSKSILEKENLFWFQRHETGSDILVTSKQIYRLFDKKRLNP
jgi:hypothetical protein